MAKQIKLMELNLNNFKGLKNYTLKADGKNVKIYGDNATGKTTIFDGFVWLLFGKDSRNKADFEIKTLDKDTGKVTLHGINHEVEAAFEIDGTLTTLKRVYAEQWTKKKGSNNKTFTGHTSDYFIDGVPVKKKGFTEKVNEIVSEDVFKLLTNPKYFNEQLGWKERRNILLDIAGDVTDEEVAEKSTNTNLAAFIEKLNGREIEDHKKVIQSQQKEINTQLERIPVRIDEINLGLPDVSEYNKGVLDRKLEVIDSDIESKRERISDIKSGGEVSNKRKELSEIDYELSTIESEHKQENQEEYYRIKASLQENKSNIHLQQRELKAQQDALVTNNKRIEDLKQEALVLKEQYHQVNNEEFEHKEECACPTCGQTLPEEQLQETREKARAEFNENKAKRLETIINQGTSKKKLMDSLYESNQKAEQKIEYLERDIDKKTQHVEKLENEMQLLENNMTDINDNPKYQAKMQEKAAVKETIEKLKSSVDESVNAVQDEINALKTDRKGVQEALNEIDVANKAKDRLAELEQQEKDLAAKYEELEKELHLTEVFTREKVNILEEKINSKFKHATFKLFDQQINGGLKETCETLYEGVPYNSGLNNAAQINIGLDIINTLNDYYGVYAPIFIDNSESVTQLIDIDTQTISLIVSEAHKQLEQVSA